MATKNGNDRLAVMIDADNAQAALVQELLRWVRAQGLSSLHLLFAQDEDLQA